MDADNTSPDAALNAPEAAADGPLEVWTDGSCDPNPGKGGWAAIIRHRDGGSEQEISGAELFTTNNRMELTAAIKALEVLPLGREVIIHTDSQYLQRGITDWIKRWQSNGWRNAQRKPVENEDLWRRLLAAEARHLGVQWRWVRGHADDVVNARADRLSNTARGGLADR